jgi:hypothetical protein
MVVSAQQRCAPDDLLAYRGITEKPVMRENTAVGFDGVAGRQPLAGKLLAE